MSREQLDSSAYTWTTLDHKTIPIDCMTTTHVANAMYYCDRMNMPDSKALLLAEWHLRENEGIWRKFTRFVRRTIFNYYKGDFSFDPTKYKTQKTDTAK